MFVEPANRRWGEKPEDPGIEQLKGAIALTAILCIGLLSTAFYLVFAREITLDDIVSVDAFSMVLVGIVLYLYMVGCEFKQGVAKRWRSRRQRTRNALFSPPRR